MTKARRDLTLDRYILPQLQRGRRRIAKGWCQRMSAQDASGARVPSSSSRAVHWCASGAVDGDLYTVARLADLANPGFTTDLAMWNDAPQRTQAQVLALYDRAIRRIQARMVTR